MIDRYWLPTLEGRTLLVRPISSDDLEALFEVASDPDLWAMHSEKDRYKREVFEPFFVKAATPPVALVVIHKATGRVIGSSRYYAPDDSQRSVVVGYTFIAKDLWQTGVNRELKRLMLDHAFRKVDTVYFHTSEGNLRSQVAIAKLGAEKNLEVIDLPGIGRRFEYRLTKERWRSICDEIS